MAVSDVWHIHVPRPEGRSPEGEGVYMPYITHCHAIMLHKSCLDLFSNLSAVVSHAF